MMIHRKIKRNKYIDMHKNFEIKIKYRKEIRV